MYSNVNQHIHQLMQNRETCVTAIKTEELTESEKEEAHQLKSIFEMQIDAARVAFKNPLHS